MRAPTTGRAESAAPPTVGAFVCWQCGKTFSQDEVIRFGEAWVCAACKPTYVQRLREGAPTLAALDYAGFWVRFGAKFIDGLIIGFVVVLPIFILAFVVGFRAARSGRSRPRAHGAGPACCKACSRRR